MSQLRIPSDAIFSVQQAFRELDERVDRIAGGGGAAGLDEATIRRIIQEEILTAVRTRRYPPIEDLMRGTGPSHMHGLVPDPGAAVGTASVPTTDQVLHEDGRWKWPLSGGLVDVTDPTHPTNRYELHGNLVVDGAISAGDLWINNLTVEGLLALKVPFCRVTHSTTQSINSGAETAISFNTDISNLFGMHSTVTNNTRLTFQQRGVAIIGSTLAIVANTTGVRYSRLALNGVTVLGYSTHRANGTVDDHIVNVTAHLVAVNDYVEVSAYQDSGGPLNVQSNNSPSTPSLWAFLLPST